MVIDRKLTVSEQIIEEDKLRDKIERNRADRNGWVASPGLVRYLLTNR